ncbi:MAG: cyclic nucleotide-binding domain-containing protein [Gammaproteobacteria bacterium]|nr:cyclic nucleotide-binding domain-containing protein [Gammaproteobacteria bacterium]MDH5618064.1 cyclic nucleotide-binding domain-containing protein [Gammaproteobacteria bacterium]
MNDKANLIASSSLGAELSDGDIELLGSLMEERLLADDEFLFEDGMTDSSLHVILTGKVEVVKRTGDDNFASLAVLREGELAGELSFIDGTPHTVGLRALSETRVLSLSREAFEGIIDSNPQLVYKVMRAVARSAHRIVHRMNTEFVELSNYIFKQHGRY